MRTARKPTAALALAGLAALLFAAPPLAAQPATRLGDLHAVAKVVGSSPRDLTAVGSRLFFTADGGVRGRGLWVSDGTALGTTLVKEGGEGGVALGNVLFFLMGGELWTSDGTPAGTRPVTAFCDSPVGCLPIQSLLVVGDRLAFVATDPTHGRELWASDGTAAGTAIVKDVNPGVGYGDPRNLASVGGTLYFTADDGIHGYELWKSDLTEAGTGLVKDIHPSGHSLPERFAGFGGLVFFAAQDAEHGQEVWRTDGTEAGTLLVADVYPGAYWNSSYPMDFTPMGDALYFSAADGMGFDRELWRTDGTWAGTRRVRDIRAGLDGSHPTDLTAVGSVLVFSADDGVSGRALWGTDGTAVGTAMLRDAQDGYLLLSPRSLVELNGAVLFAATGRTQGPALWRTDGTAAGTTMVKDVDPEGPSSPDGLTRVGGQVFFSACDALHWCELWKTDGTAGGTSLVADVNPGVQSSLPSRFVELNGIALFAAEAQAADQELWRSDGTPAGTTLVKDIYPGGLGSRPQGTTVAGGLAYFSARDASSGWELWRSNGTPEGTALVKDISSGSSAWSSSPGHFVRAGPRLLFSATDADHGRELWTSDGTAAGTTLVRDIDPGPGSSLAGTTTDSRRVSYAGRAFFAANDGIHGSHLWSSDGTAAGTVRVEDRPDDPFRPNDARELADLRGRLYFLGPWELWRTDGTSEGTQLAATPCAGGCHGAPWGLTEAGGRLFFALRTGPPGWGSSVVWASDGTAVGTIPVKAFGNDRNVDLWLVRHDDRLFFLSRDSLGGRIGLWTSDGTPEGTTLIKELEGAGLVPLDGEGPRIWSAGGALFFVGYTPATGHELWTSDGTPEGTVLVQDIAPGPLSSWPTELAAVGPRLFFSANDGQAGREPWALPLGPYVEIDDVTVDASQAGEGTAFFAVRLVGGAGPATVAFATEDGTARAGADYTATSGTLALDPGAPTGTIEVAVTGDATPRANGTFSVRLSNAIGAVIARPRASGAIVRSPREADVAVGISCPGTAVAGRTLECTLTLVNNGPLDAPSVAASVELSSGLQHVSNAGDCVTAFPCSFPSLPARQSRSIATVFSVASALAPGPLMLTARAVATERDPELANNSATATVSVTRLADLAITSTAPTTVEAGQDLTYAIRVTNQGPSSTTSVQVQHPTPPGLTLVSVTGACSGFPCALSSLAAGGGRAISARYAVSPVYTGANPLASTAGTASAEPDPDLSDNFAIASTTITPRSLARDLLWHHQVAGDLYAWFLKGTVTFDGTHLTPSRFADTRWQIRGLADFDGDGATDVLWHHQGTGELYVWFMSGTVAARGAYLTPARFTDTGWQIRATTDFDGDGDPDILWHHQGTGDLYVWLMDGTVAADGAYLTPSRFADTRWQIRAVADWNGDGETDLLWHHQGTGELYVWQMKGLAVSGGAYLTPSRFSDTRWKIVRAADFDGDARPDLLWHHQGTGELYVWFMNGPVAVGGSYLTPSRFADVSWKIVPQ